MVERELPKLRIRVRFPLLAPIKTPQLGSFFVLFLNFISIAMPYKWSYYLLADIKRL